MTTPQRKFHWREDWALYRRLLRETITPYVRHILLTVLCMAVAGGAQGLLAWLMQPVIDDVFTQKNPAMLFPIAACVLGANLVKGTTIYLQAILMTKVGLGVVSDLQRRLFRHMLSLDVRFFDMQGSSKLVSRFMIDIGQMRAGATGTVVSLGRDSLTAVALIGVMFYQDWLLAFVAIFVWPLSLHPIRRIALKIRRTSMEMQALFGVFTGVLDQSFQGIRMVKSYNLEDYEQAEIDRLTGEIQRLSFKATKTGALVSPLMETLGGVAVTIVILYGGWRVIDGTTTAGAFFSFITALLMAYRPLKSLAGLNVSIQGALAAAERFFKILDQKSEIVEKPDAQPLRVSKGAIVFESVRFGYEEGRPVLDGLSLQVEGGQTVAMVGLSGGGKTTIANLIPRFYDVEAGSIRIDGCDVRDVTLASLNRHIALVSQDVILFDATIRANIAFGAPGASDAEIEHAARLAAAHDFIVQTPMGYDTVIGQRGMRLSGGQRQRLSIARAILKNAPILLLDEATSSLDMESERQIQEALTMLMKGRTTVVIAHRLSTIVGADVINVVEQGRIVESGSHAALLEQDGVYARLYALQLASQDTEAPEAAASN